MGQSHAFFVASQSVHLHPSRYRLLWLNRSGEFRIGRLLRSERRLPFPPPTCVEGWLRAEFCLGVVEEAIWNPKMAWRVGLGSRGRLVVSAGAVSCTLAASGWVRLAWSHSASTVLREVDDVGGLSL